MKLTQEEYKLNAYEENKKKMVELVLRYAEKRDKAVKHDILLLLESTIVNEGVRIDIRKPSYWGKTDSSKGREWDRFEFLPDMLLNIHTKGGHPVFDELYALAQKVLQK